MCLAVFLQFADIGKDMGDSVYVLFLLVVIWLVLEIDGGSNGGKRARVPAV